MTKIQIIIDDEKSLKAFTCTDLQVLSMPAYEGTRYLHSNPTWYQFIANNILVDDSPNLVSLPDELLLRIRDYNIDAERQYAIEQTLKLKEEIEFLKGQVHGWELRRDLVQEEVERYHEVLRGMIDRYPMAAAEICLQDHNLEAACYFAEKANEEKEDETRNDNISSEESDLS